MKYMLDVFYHLFLNILINLAESFSLKETFSEKNMNMFVGLISLLIALWLVMFAVPDLFVSLFDTPLGNLILIVFIFVSYIVEAVGVI